MQQSRARKHSSKVSQAIENIEFVVIAHDYVQDGAADGGRGGTSGGQHVSDIHMHMHMHACMPTTPYRIVFVGWLLAVILVSYAASQAEKTLFRGESVTRKHIELVFIAHNCIQDRAAGGGRGVASLGRYVSDTMHDAMQYFVFWIIPYVLCSRTEPVVIPQRWTWTIEHTLNWLSVFIYPTHVHAYRTGQQVEGEVLPRGEKG